MYTTDNYMYLDLTETTMVHLFQTTSKTKKKWVLHCRWSLNKGSVVQKTYLELNIIVLYPRSSFNSKTVVKYIVHVTSCPRARSFIVNNEYTASRWFPVITDIDMLPVPWYYKELYNPRITSSSSGVLKIKGRKYLLHVNLL